MFLSLLTMKPGVFAKSARILIFTSPLFSRNWTEYGVLLCKSLFSVQMQENMD